MTRKLNPKSKSAHMATPLTFAGTFEPNGDKMTYHIVGGITKVDGEFMIRACNSHERLLEACKAALMDMSDDALYQEHRETYETLKSAIAEAEK